MFKLLDRLPSLYSRADDARRADLLRVLGSNYVLRGENVEPNYSRPFDRVAAGVETGDWRSIVDEVQTAIEATQALVAAS
jgi:hypothetical protein